MRSCSAEKKAIDVQSVSVADLDGDGDIDVWTELQGGRLEWYEQFQPRPGDANLDGEFNQSDLVLVLQGAKFFDAESAMWEDGDWDGDFVFTQRDTIAALQTGMYLQGPYVDA